MPGEDPLYVDPTRAGSERFLHALEQLDRLAYAPSGMATPRWALYDCAQLPGAVIGLCAELSALPDSVREALEVEGEGLVPLTFLMALPMLERNAWLVHSVCGVSEMLQIGTRDLRPATMRFAYSWLGVKRVTSICQWKGDRVMLHGRWGALDLLAAWMPSHDIAATCTFRYVPSENRELHGSIAPRDAFPLDDDDEAGFQELQRALERGEGLRVVDVGPLADGRRRAWLIRTEGPK